MHSKLFGICFIVYVNTSISILFVLNLTSDGGETIVPGETIRCTKEAPKKLLFE
jgi:hypothetical protein